jgi:hypothetical protein
MYLLFKNKKSGAFLKGTAFKAQQYRSRKGCVKFLQFPPKSKNKPCFRRQVSWLGVIPRTLSSRIKKSSDILFEIRKKF